MHLTWKRRCSFLKPLLIYVTTKWAPSDSTTDARLLVGLPRGRPGRLESLDRPTFWDDPASCSARGDKQHLDASLQVETVRQRSELNTSWPSILGSLLTNRRCLLLYSQNSCLRSLGSSPRVANDPIRTSLQPHSCPGAMESRHFTARRMIRKLSTRSVGSARATWPRRTEQCPCTGAKSTPRIRRVGWEAGLLASFDRRHRRE
jgi:hypothetical protein